jgi:uncharacterized protein (DUF427 family)
MAGNPAPGFATHPHHRIAITPDTARVRVVFNDLVIADSRRALRLEEDGYGPVYYLPRGDVRMDLLARTDHSTRCPFKGEASYYSLKVSDQGAENAVWSYETPYDEMAAIKEHLAFYPNKVAIRVEPA